MTQPGVSTGQGTVRAWLRIPGCSGTARGSLREIAPWGSGKQGLGSSGSVDARRAWRARQLPCVKTAA